MRTLFSTFLVALFALITASCSAATNDERDGLIDAYLNWRGGEAYTNADTIVQTGAAEVYNFSGTIQVIQTRDGYSRSELDLGPLEVLDVVTPDGGWSINPNGQIEDMGAPVYTDARRDLEHDLAVPFLGARENVSRLEDETRGGANWGVIRILYDNGDYADYFIDPDTGALEWIRNRRDTGEYWQHLTDWRMVDGVRLPGRTELLFQDEAENQTYVWTEQAVNMPIPAIAFERQGQADRVTIAGGAPSTGWIDFDFFRGNRLFLPATIEGHTTQAILDSGAEVTAIDLSLAREIGLELSGPIQANGAGGTQEAYLASDIDFVIGDLQFTGMTVVAIDLSEIANYVGRPLPLIVGKELFNEMIVDIDYPRHRIAFHDPESWTYNGDGARVALPEFEDSRSVAVSVEGRAPIGVSFDIGQGAALTLFESYVNDAGLLTDGRPLSDQMGGGVGGASARPITHIATLDFGGVTLHDVPVSLSLAEDGSFDTVREGGNLGTEIFNRFHMIVNYGADELILEPDAALVDATFDTNTAGVQGVVTEGGLAVSHVMANSPAMAAGLTDADVITAIDGAAVTVDYWEGDQWRWVYGDPGTIVTLTLADGRNVPLTLSRFY